MISGREGSCSPAAHILFLSCADWLQQAVGHAWCAPAVQVGVVSWVGVLLCVCVCVCVCGVCVVFGRAYRYVDGTAMCLAGCNACLLAGAAAVTPGAACCALHLSCMLAHAVWMEGTCLCRPEVAGVSMRLPAASFGRCRAPWQTAADAVAPTATVCGAEMSSLLMRHAHVT